MPAQFKREADLAFWRRRAAEERVMAADTADTAKFAHGKMADGYALLASRSLRDAEAAADSEYRSRQVGPELGNSAPAISA